MRRVAVLLAALLVAGCNSTTRLTTEERARGGDFTVEDGAALEGDAAGAVEGGGQAGDAGTVAGGTGGGPGRTRAGAAGGAAGGGSASTGGSGAGGALGAVTGRTRGVTKDSIKIGLRYYDEEGMAAFTAAYGIQGSLPQPRAYLEALIADINKRGGLAGRRIEPVWHAVDATRSATQVDATNEEACATFTEDNEVFAVATTLPGGVGDTFTGCLAKSDTPLVTDPLVYVDREFTSKYAEHLYLPGAVQSTRLSGFWVDKLAARGFFKNAKVGVLWYDDPSGIYERTVEQGLRPALARHGSGIAEQFVLSSYTDSTQYSSAALRFKTAGVTHLLILDVSSLVSFFFMAAADGQAYYPKYGLNSMSAFSFLEQNVPDSQASNVTGVGWIPALDVARRPPDAFDGPEERCLALLRAAGGRVDGPYTLLLAFWSCDVLWFLEAVLARAPTLDPPGLRAGTRALGTAYQAPGTFRTAFLGGRNDGLNAARDVAYDGSCACFVYASGPYDVG